MFAHRKRIRKQAAQGSGKPCRAAIIAHDILQKLLRPRPIQIKTTWHLS